MRLNCVAAAVFLLPGAFAQKPPTPDAILVAGASPAVNRATDVVLNPRFLAVAPDGTLYLAARRNEGGVLVEHVWRVDTAGTLSAVPGPWEAATDAQTIILAIAADASGNLYISGRRLWKLTPKGAVTTIAGLGLQPPSESAPCRPTRWRMWRPPWRSICKATFFSLAAGLYRWFLIPTFFSLATHR